MDDNILRLTDDLGNTKEYEILMTLKMEETNKNYIIYTDNTSDLDGILNIYASIYNIENNKLEDIKTDREWDIIHELLERNMNRGK